MKMTLFQALMIIPLIFGGGIFFMAIAALYDKHKSIILFLLTELIAAILVYSLFYYVYS